MHDLTVSEIWDKIKERKSATGRLQRLREHLIAQKDFTGIDMLYEAMEAVINGAMFDSVQLDHMRGFDLELAARLYRAGKHEESSDIFYSAAVSSMILSEPDQPTKDTP